MKLILRSVIDIQSTIPPKSLTRNLFYLADSDLKFIKEEDEPIWDFIKDYALSYSEAPSSNTIQDYFEKERNLAVLDRLEEIIACTKTYDNSNFENLVREGLRKQRDRETGYLLQEASRILTGGLTMKVGREKKTYKGYQDALRFIMERSDDLLVSDSGSVLRSEIISDAEEVKKEFQNTLSNPHLALGRPTGLQIIDDECRGLKHGELWIHAASVGELKTTMALNWAYKTAVYMKYNVYYFSLEMTVEDIRRIFYVMHSNHVKFRAKGYKALDYRTIRDGINPEGERISQEQIDFFNMVIQDFEDGAGKEYGSIFVECPEQEATVPYMKSRVELIHQATPIHMTVIDHFGLVRPSKSSGNFHHDLNSIIRDTKRFALTFNRGEKMPVLALMQINREGKKEADKNDGIYRTQALADANEAERSADVITYTYLNDDLRDAGETKVGCIKNRNGVTFKPFLAKIDFGSRYLSDLDVSRDGTTGFDLV